MQQLLSHSLCGKLPSNTRTVAYQRRKQLPAFTFAMSLDNDLDIMNETLQLAKDNKLKACVDDRGPFSFTTEGAREAFQLQESRHVRGKVVIDFKK